MHLCKIIVRKIIGKVDESETDKVPVSDNAISWCGCDMSHDAEDVLSGILKNTNFALQVDEQTDIINKAQLLAFVRFKNEGEIMENLYIVYYILCYVFICLRSFQKLDYRSIITKLL
jgi:hypothetical protein